ncbi:MAG: peptidase M16 [SAR86 cluster bacterium]|uniref:Peptidase M16 n=1 Tax=SAR86 cluster bacterium TaxID=2030880 RepID=A0A2A5BA36_9GAMM|nr:MAG: peptidase M16 [SAR86 cluster bacterium]
MTEVHTANAEQQTNAPKELHPAFEWKRSELIPSLNIVMEEYNHRKTGAKHFHLSSDNPENVFLVAFRTVPMDSTGVAHILEHTALCGSSKYPVRDPFFMMIRRSLNTFMNAFTSSDWTAYPFASKNRKDFSNLLAVYLDAAFFSRLHKLDFAQEGHRLEFSDASNSDSELQYKGVVFNEMKGAMSSTNSVLWQTLSKYLFPTTTYHFNSGGEPDNIPDLKYEELLSFYKSHYHPSNSVFMTYGDIPASEHHKQFEELALSSFEKLDIDIKVGDENRYLSPIRIEESYAADASDKPQSHVVVGWLLGQSTQLDELFKAELLSSVLLDNSANPLFKVLETTELGSSPSPMCGLEDSNREMSFMAGLEGCEGSSTLEIEKLIIDTLEETVRTGIPLEQVEAALHQVELNQREISGDSYPYGLQLILAGLSTAMHRGDPIALLNIDPVLAQLREEIKDDRFIPNLIQELLLDNPHRITLTLNPDPQLATRKINAEIQKLAKIKSALSEDQKQEIINQSSKLAKRQEEDDDPGVLPKVGLEDVPEKITEPARVSLKSPKIGLPVTYYGQGTNGLCYQQIIMDLPQLDSELLDILPLYTSCLTELGVADKNYADVQAWQAQVSGGISCFSSIRSSNDDVQNIKGIIAFSSKCLANKHTQLSELMHATIQNVRFDEDQRLRDLIEQICARKENSITGQGHSLAMSLASSKMSPTALLNHRFGGLEGIAHLKTLRDQLNSEPARIKVLDKFQQLHSLVLAAKKEFLLIAEPDNQASVISDIDKIWQAETSNNSDSKLSLPSIRETVRQAWTTSTQVNFCAKAYATVPSSHEDNASLQVLAGFLRNGFLHRTIREQGGAYGGGASQDAGSASFKFFSYRDPRLQETLDDFDRAIDWLMTNKHQPHQLEEAILGIIASMDKPASPAGEAKQAYYNHVFDRSIEYRMTLRKRILNTTVDDLKLVAERYFKPEQASIGIITNKELAEALNIQDLSLVNL